MIVGALIVGARNKGRVNEYSNYYKSAIPKTIGKLSGVEVKVPDDVYAEKYLEDKKKKRKPNMTRKETIKHDVKDTMEYNKKMENYKSGVDYKNAQQFIQSNIVDADTAIADNIAVFQHEYTKTTIDFYKIRASKKYEYYTYEENRRGEKRKVKHTDYKPLTAGTVLSIENLENINLDGIRILIKDDDSFISHVTENTVDSMKNMKNEMKFNRADLNKSFDCFVYNTSKNKKENENDLKQEALKTLTPVVEDLLAYIRKKMGRFNLAINNNKIDIEFLDFKVNSKTKKTFNNMKIKPKLFGSNDLKISYLYRFYELIEIQKIILKYFNCYPEKYIITDEDVQGLREAVETNKITDDAMDMEVKDYYESIMKEG